MSPLPRSAEIDVLEGIDRIAASGALGGGERLPAMLRWLVREELAGRGERIKSFSIATEVLGRGDGFDPQSDSIARAEMGRLRRALELHYATDGRSEPVRITIPKGSYRPVISIAPQVEAESGVPPPALEAREQDRGGIWRVKGLLLAIAATAIVLPLVLWATLGVMGPGRPEEAADPPASGPSLLIQSVRAEPSTDAARPIADGLKAELAARLSSAAWLTVILQPDGMTPDVPHRYALDVRINHADGRYTVRTFLKRQDNAIRWQKTYTGSYLHRETEALIAEVAKTIADDLGRTGGIIEQQEAILTTDGAAADEQAFACRLVARRYWRTYDATLAAEAESCMRTVLAANPASREARAVLALLAIETARGATGPAREEALDTATTLLAPIQDPGSLTLTAQLALAACRGDRAAVIDMSGRLRSRFPNDPAVLADIGSKLGLAAGDWPQALDAEARALALNPFPDPWYPLATAVKALLDLQPAAALAAFARTPQRDFMTGRIVLLSIGGLLRDRMIIERERESLAQAGLPTADLIRARLASECWSAQAKAAVRAGLDAALP